jgi:hypothetical protein
MTHIRHDILDGRLKKIYERVEENQEPLLNGPETIVFGNDGTMYALTEDGFLVSLTHFKQEETNPALITAKVNMVADLGMGRPLGGKFKDDILYIADAHLGLTRLKNPGRGNNKVELVASRVLDQGKWTQILYANDVAVGPKVNTI